MAVCPLDGVDVLLGLDDVPGEVAGDAETSDDDVGVGLVVLDEVPVIL